MNGDEALRLADGWMGEGMELAHRVLVYADMLRSERLDSGTKSDVADDLEQIVSRDWNPREQPR